MKAKRTKTKRPILKNLVNLHKDPIIVISPNGNDSAERVQDMDLDSEEQNEKTVMDIPLVQSQDDLKSHNESTLESPLIQEDNTTGPQSPVVNEKQEAVNSESQNTALSKTPVVPLEKENANECEPTLQSKDSDATMFSAFFKWENTELPDSPLSSIDYDLLQSPNLIDTDQFGMGTASDNSWSLLTKESIEGLKGAEYKGSINFDDYSAQIINTEKLVFPMQMVSISYAEVLPDDNDPNYYCRVCKMTSDSRSSFYVHLTNYHKMILKPLLWWRITDLEVLPDENDPGFYCKLCQKKYKSVYTFRAHIKNIHKKQRKQSLITTEDSGFPCPTCNQVLKSKYSLQRHIYSRHKPVQFNQEPDKEEPNADEPSVDDLNVDNHNYYCSVCDKTSSSKTAFRVHCRKVHMAFANPDVLPDKYDPNNYCTTCDIIFKQKQGFQRHLLRFHDTNMITDEPPSSAALLPDENNPENYCYLCDHKFSSKQSFRNHIKTIHGKKMKLSTEPNPNEDRAPVEPSPPNQEIVGHKSKSTSVKSKINKTRTRNTISNTALSTIEVEARRCGLCDRKFGNRKGLCIHLIHAHRVQCRVSTCLEVNAKLTKSPTTTSVASKSPDLCCGACNRQFGNERVLCSHLIQTHKVQCNLSTCVQANTDLAKSTEAETAPTIPMVTSDSTIPTFHCGICSKEFAKERGLCIHLVLAHKVRCRLSNCVEVNASLVSSSPEETDLLLPSTNNTDEPEDAPKYYCSACNKEFASNRGLCTHLNLAHYVKCTFSTCAEIGTTLAKSLEKELDLPPTASNDENSPRFQCGTCSRGFGSERGLCMHLIKAHKRQFTGSTPVSSKSTLSSLICRLCDKECVKERGLCMHLSVTHNIRSTRLTCVQVNAKLVKSPETDLPPTTPTKTKIASSKTDDPNFYCSPCKRTFATDRGLCNHLIFAHKLQCTLSTCVEASTNLKKSLESDLPSATTPVDVVASTSDNVTKYICRLCDRVCAKEIGLCRHISMVHNVRSSRLTCVDINSKLVKPLTEESDLSAAPNNTNTVTSESEKNSPSIPHCKTCNRRFASKIGLCMHLIKIHKLQTAKPAHANSVKSPKSNLPPPGSTNSSTAANFSSEFKCDACDRKFGSKFGSQMHFSLAHKKRKFKSRRKVSRSKVIVDAETSKQPSETTTAQSNLLPDKNDPKNYCKICDKTLSSTKTCRMHLFSQHQIVVEPRYRIFKSNDDVLPDIHNPNRYCRACDKTYINKQSFRDHIEQRHRMLFKKYTTATTMAAAAAQGSKSQSIIGATKVDNDTVVHSPDLYCKECDFVYSTIGSYRKHFSVYHRKERKENTRKRKRSTVTHGTPAGSGSANVDDYTSGTKRRKIDAGNVSDSRDKRPAYKEGRGVKWVNPDIRPDIDDPKFHCKPCQITLETETAYQNHLTLIHRMYVPEETFHCNSCNKSYRSKEHFDNHLSHFHTSTPRKKLATTSNKRKATTTAPTKKIAVLPKKKAREPGNYTVQHICDVCQEAQKTKGGLRNHRQVVHGVTVEFDVQQKYCNLCQSRYADRRGYRIHLKDMHGLKPPMKPSTPIADSHFCKLCNIAYRSSVHYQLHCFKHHSLEL